MKTAIKYFLAFVIVVTAPVWFFPAGLLYMLCMAAYIVKQECIDRVWL